MASTDFEPSGWLPLVNQDPSYEDRTLDTLKAIYEEKLKVFEGSIEYRLGTETLDKVFRKQENIRISSAMFLGLGSLSSKNWWDGTLPCTESFGPVPIAQYIAFVSWIKHLEKEHKQTIETIRFQDPKFNKTDRDFIHQTDSRHKVIDSPDSERFINKETFLYTTTVLYVMYSSLSVSSPSDLWINQEHIGMITINDSGEPDESTYSVAEQQRLIAKYLKDHAAMPLLRNGTPGWANTLVLGSNLIHYRSDDKNDLLSLEELKEMRMAGHLSPSSVKWQDKKK